MNCSLNKKRVTVVLFFSIGIFLFGFVTGYLFLDKMVEKLRLNDHFNLIHDEIELFNFMGLEDEQKLINAKIEKMLQRDLMFIAAFKPNINEINENSFSILCNVQKNKELLHWLLAKDKIKYDMLSNYFNVIKADLNYRDRQQREKYDKKNIKDVQTLLDEREGAL